MCKAATIGSPFDFDGIDVVSKIAADKSNPCRGCIGERNTDRCDDLPDCMPDYLSPDTLIFVKA